MIKKQKTFLIQKGYLGTSIVPQLLEAGCSVTIFDLFLNGVVPLLSYTSNSNLRLIKGDVLDKDHLASVMSNADVVIHLAAVVGYPACDANPDYARELNIEGTRNVTSLLKPNQQLIFSSTGSCYGVVKDICTEETELNPISLYGHTKVVGEQLALKANGVVLRFATLFGCSPLMRLDLLINDLTCQALNRSNLDIYEPHFKRTFLHVKDAARSFLFAIEHYDQMHGQIYNVGDEQMNYTKEDVVHRIVKHVKACEFNLCAKGSDKDKRDYYVSYEKINKLGFNSQISLDEGIEELLRVLPAFSKQELNLFRRLSEKIC